MAQFPQLRQGAALQSVIDRFGGRVREQEFDRVVGVAPGSVIGNDPDRLALVLVNLSAVQINLSLRAGVTLTTGFILGANGGALLMDVNEDYTLPSREWFAIAAAAGSALYVLEIVRDVTE